MVCAADNGSLLGAVLVGVSLVCTVGTLLIVGSLLVGAGKGGAEGLTSGHTLGLISSGPRLLVDPGNMSNEPISTKNHQMV